MLPGECLGLRGASCPECYAVLKLKVLSSPAGYYYGYWCFRDGPISRESEYFSTRELCEVMMKLGAGFRT